MRNLRLTSLIALAVLALACSAPEPPAVPSWDVDVYPILRGNCSHCHGMTVGGLVPGTQTAATPTTRYDVCNTMAFTAQGLTIGLGGAGAFALALVGAVKAPVRGMRMPPPPAGPLSAYDITVLERWARNPSCNKQVMNVPPTVRIVTPLARAGNRVTVTIEVADPDGDQVLGKAKLGTGMENEGNTYLIKGAGRWTVEFSAGNPTDPLSINIFDGYAPVRYP